MGWADLISLLIRHTLLLLAVVNPIGNIPVYADLTATLEKRERRRVMNLAVCAALSILVVLALIGSWSLKHVFDVSLTKFPIAGGVLLFIVAMRGVIGRNKKLCPSKDKNMVAVFPVAFPMMVGPGAITATIITSDLIGHWLMVATAFAAFAIVFCIAHSAHLLMRLIGSYAGIVVARLLYIFVAAKAVSMILSGMEEFLVRVSSLTQRCG
ncbi:MAG: MarC family protein [Planctomycetota bacterium]|jgi:multiple antibiotic resistance protein